MSKKGGWNEYDPYSSSVASNIHHPHGYYGAPRPPLPAGMPRAEVERRPEYLLEPIRDFGARPKLHESPQLHVSFVTHRMDMFIDAVRVMKDIQSCCPTAFDLIFKKQRVDDTHCSQSGYGFVAFPNMEDCLAAKQRLKGMTINGMTYDCELAHRSSNKNESRPQHTNYPPLAPSAQYPQRMSPDKAVTSFYPARPHRPPDPATRSYSNLSPAHISPYQLSNPINQYDVYNCPPPYQEQVRPVLHPPNNFHVNQSHPPPYYHDDFSSSSPYQSPPHRHQGHFQASFTPQTNGYSRLPEELERSEYLPAGLSPGSHNFQPGYRSAPAMLSPRQSPHQSYDLFSSPSEEWFRGYDRDGRDRGPG